MIKQLYNRDMKARVTYKGQQYDELRGDNGVKQSDILARHLS